MPELFPCEAVGLDFIDRARFRSSQTVDLAITPEQLWHVLEDPEAWPKWSPITHMTWTRPPPFGIGTTRTIGMRRGAVAVEEVIAWNPHRHMAFRMNKCSDPAAGASLEEHRIDPMPGGCRLTWTLAHHPIQVRWLDRVFAKPAMTVMYRNYLTELRRYTDLRFGLVI